MDIEQIIEQAQRVAAEDRAIMQDPAYIKTIAWLHYLGLLRHNQISPKRHQVNLTEALAAGELEPRVYELLPAVMVMLPKAFKYNDDEIPNDLSQAMTCLRKNQQRAANFRGIPPQKYRYWQASNLMEIARRKIDARHLPRRRFGSSTNAIGEVILNGRLMLAMNQRQLAKEYSISLRVLRDLEQGKMDASLKMVNRILEIFGRQLRA